MVLAASLCQVPPSNLSCQILQRYLEIKQVKTMKGDRHFELVFASATLNWRLYHCPKRLPAHYTQYDFDHFHVGFPLSNIFLFVFVQSSFTLVYSSGSTERWSERWAHFKTHRVWVVMENYTWSKFHVNHHWFDTTHITDSIQLTNL